MKSLYVHIPFCDHICTYCDFCKVFYKKEWADLYLEALSFEIKDKNIKDDYDTIYIGGGTPSSLSYQQLQSLFELLKPLTNHIIEYSIEVNPESLDDQKIQLMKDYRINRVSIGIQTFDDSLLKSLNRKHTGYKAIQCIQKLQSIGIDDINVDLMYGLPQQKLEDVYADIQQIAKMNIPHVSVYSLILEDHTVLKNDGYIPLDDEQDAYWYESINRYLEKYQYKHYEVSNYYKKKPSLHNLVYWHYQDYDGIGLSAHSLKNHHRLENTRSLTQYLRHDYLDEDIYLEESDEIFEKIMMGLRLTEGICMNDFSFDFYLKYKEVINKYIKLNMLEMDGCYLKTTALGMNYLNTILIDFLDDDFKN